ncbi:MAG: M20 family metallopeptidase [Bacteroidales bacterium]|nr:M20 family metallopeptidase [Bacteroidales bacterium]
MSEIKQQIELLSGTFFEEVVAIRRHFHQNPELSCEEFQTAEFICKKLDEYGIPYQDGVAETGVVGLIEGKNASSGCIALRADMDALPIREENDVVYKSKNAGKMHACGHDVHMACLLGAAKILNSLKDQFEGTVKLIFQPSEENYPGGAIRMINEGALKNPSPGFVIAQHVINTLDAGDVGMRSGAYMASTDEIFITVRGKGGHAATPSQVIDPILIASHIIVALQQIVSRNADPVMPTVLSFGRIVGDGRTNIIPDEVKIDGTVRTYSETWRKEVHRRIERIAVSMASGMGGTCDVRISHGYPFLYNDPALTDKLYMLASEYLGAGHVKELEQRMTAEDFAYFAKETPSCMFRLGIANEEKGISSNLHTATFDVDELSLKTGMGLLAWFAVEILGELKAQSEKK